MFQFPLVIYGLTCILQKLVIMGNSPIKLKLFSYEGKIQSICDINVDDKIISASITENQQKRNHILCELRKYSTFVGLCGNKNALSVRTRQPQKKTLSISGPYHYNKNEYFIFKDDKSKLSLEIDGVSYVFVLEKTKKYTTDFKITMIEESLLVHNKFSLYKSPISN